MLSPDMEITWVNNIMESWFGSCTQLIGRKCYECFRHSDSVCENCPAKKAFADNRFHASELCIGYTNKGKKKYYQLNAAPILDSHGKTEKVFETLIDVTEKRKKEVKNRRRFAETRKLNREIARMSKTFKKLANKRSQKLKLAHEELSTLYQLSNRLISSLDVREVLNSVINIVPRILKVAGCMVRILDDTKKQLKLEASVGVSNDFKNNAQFMPLGEGISGLVLETKSPIAIADITHDERIRYYRECLKEGIRSLLATPIMIKERVLGVIIAFSKKTKRFTKSEINLLATFAAHVAVALNNALLHEQVYHNYYNTISTLVRAVEAKDPYTCGHSERVTHYSLKIGKKLNLSDKELRLLFYGGKLHDIGKIAIPDFILKKTTTLTLMERAEIEAHPIKGVEMVMPLPFLHACLPLIRHHHERFDGTGYPDRCKGEKIPLLARILSLADAFDAMTSERPYRKSLSFSEAIEEIKRNTKTQFDPSLTKPFLELLGSQGHIRATEESPMSTVRLAS